MRLRLGMLASHNGTNVQSVVEACSEGRLAAEPAIIISNNRDAAVLEFGRVRGVPSVWIGGSAYEDQTLRDEATCGQLAGHGGKGKFGIHVHESVLASRDTEKGVSIHLVDAQYDEGPVIAQCRIPVLDNDSPATLQARVLGHEHEFLVEMLNQIVAGWIRLP